jgi:hypothetical protein
VKRTLLAFILLLCAPAMWATVCTSTGSGNFRSITWSGGGNCATYPQSIDTAAIATGNVVTIPSGETDTVAATTTAGTGTLIVSGTLISSTVTTAGTGSANCTTEPFTLSNVCSINCKSGSVCTFGSSPVNATTFDVAIGAGTVFTLDYGGLFNMLSGVTIADSATTLTGVRLNGHTVCTPNATSNHYLLRNTGAAGSDKTTISIHGVDYVSQYAVFETAAGQDSGQNCLIGTGGFAPQIHFQNAIIHRCGDASSSTTTCSTGTQGSPASSISIANVMLLNSGTLSTYTNSGESNTSTYDINGLDIRNPNGNGGIAILLRSTDAGVFTGTRYVRNMTSYGTTSHLISSQINGVKVGLSARAGDSQDSVGYIGYNTHWTGGTNVSMNNTISNSLILTYNSSTAFVVGFTNSGFTIQDTVFFDAIDNPKRIQDAGTSAGGGNIMAQWLFTDGGYYYGTDSGETCSFAYPGTCQYNIGINGNANPAESRYSTNGFTLSHLVSYRQAATILGHAGSSTATAFNSLYDSVFDYPMTSDPGQCNPEEGGVAELTAFISQTTGYIDNNMRWAFPNQTDGRSCTAAGAYPLTTGTVNGVTAVRSAISSKTITGLSGSGTLTLDCSGCTSTAAFNQAGELAVISGDIVWDTTTNAGIGFVQSVSSGTRLVMLLSSGSFTNGDTFTIYKNTWANGTQYGSATNYGLHDFAANPRFFNPGFGVCQYYNAYVSNTLTCPTTPGVQTNTNLVAVAQAAVTLNGWDYGSASSLAGTNCTSACPTHVTPVTVMSPPAMLPVLRNAYKIYNGMAEHAGHDGSDLGVSVFPAAILQ